MHKRTLLAAVSFAVVALAGFPILIAARADEEAPPISVTLQQSTALDLRGQLANVHGPAPLEVLGLKDAADFRPVVPVPMRDGIHLAASLILPRGAEGQRLPVILIRTPYTPASEVSEPLAPSLLSRAVKSGYAVVIELVEDPMNPVPPLGGSCCSEEVARDQSPIEARQDVLVYTSEPLAAPALSQRSRCNAAAHAPGHRVFGQDHRTRDRRGFHARAPATDRVGRKQISELPAEPPDRGPQLR